MYRKLLIISLSFFITTISYAAPVVEKVITEGMGVSQEAAMKNAAKSAIRQVVGMYVVSDTIVKNNQLIKDEVLSNSNGYIKTFNVISSSSEDGLFNVEAEVEVEVGKLTTTLGKLNIAIKNIATDQFKVKLDTKFSSIKDFSTLFNKIVIDPIVNNEKIYNIKINSFEPLPDEYSEFKYEFIQGDKARFESGEIVPFILKFNLGLNENYFNSVQQFLSKASKFQKQGSSGFFTMSKVNIPSSKSIRVNFDHQFYSKDNSFDFSDVNERIIKSSLGRTNKYRKNLLIHLTDSKGDEFDYVSMDGHREFKVNRASSGIPISSLSASKLAIYSLVSQSGAPDHPVWHDFGYGSSNIYSGLESRNLIKNESELAISILLTREQAEKVQSIKITLNWVEK